MKIKRLLAIFLCMMMIVGLMPASTGSAVTIVQNAEGGTVPSKTNGTPVEDDAEDEDVDPSASPSPTPTASATALAGDGIVVPTDSIIVEDDSDALATEDPLPEEEPTEEPTEEPIVTPEPTEEPVAVVEPLSTSISFSPAEVVLGEKVTLTATISGGTHPQTYQWQWATVPEGGVLDANSLDWQNEPGATDLSYTYVATEETLGRAWRLMVSMPEAQPEETEEGETALLSSIGRFFFSSANAEDGSNTISYTEVVMPQAAPISTQATVPITSFTLDATSFTLDVGKTRQITAVLTPSNADPSELTWKSSNEAVATVNSNGVVTAVGTTRGTARITATAANKRSVSVTVTVQPMVREIEVTMPNGDTVSGGKTLQLAARFLQQEPYTKALTWSSSNTSVATVSNTGLVRAQNIGYIDEVQINAVATDGSNVKSNSVTVRVIPAVTSITISPPAGANIINNVVQTKEGGNVQLSAAVLPSTVASNYMVEWVSLNPTIASVDSNGLVRGLAKGTATIRATAGGKSTTIRVAVQQLATSIQVKNGTNILPDQGATLALAGGKTLRLTATILPTTASVKTFTWSSDDDSVATVSNVGLITAKDVVVPKTVNITVKANDESGLSWTVSVTVSPIVSRVVIEKKTGSTYAQADSLGINLSSGESSIIVRNENYPANVSQAVTWRSSNTSVATVSVSSTDNRQDVTITGHRKGTANIVATATDGSNRSVSVPVTVASLINTITITNSDLSLTAGRTLALKVNFDPADATNRNLTWTSSDTAIATVSTSGVVTAKQLSQPTKVTITATAKDGSGVEGKIDLMIVPAITAISIHDSDGTAIKTYTYDLTTMSESKFTAQVTPSGAARDVTWKINNTSIATIAPYETVDNEGNVFKNGVTLTGIKNGTVTLTATTTDGSNRSTSISVKIVTGADSIKINGSNVLAQGKTTRLTVEFDPPTVTSKTVVWYSNNPEVASVNQSTGVVTGVTNGQAEIVARTDTGKEAKITIVVYSAATRIVIYDETSGSSQIVTSGLSLDAGKTLKLRAQVLPSDSSDVTWTSSNSNVAGVTVSTDSNGTYAIITPVNKGTAVITAKAKDGTTVSASVTITVGTLATKINIHSSLPSVNENGTTVYQLSSGKTATLTLDFVPPDVTSKTVTWESSDTSVATVSANGLVTAKYLGVTKYVTITATSTTAKETVKDANNNDVIVPVKGTITIKVGPGTSSIAFYTNPSDLTTKVASYSIPLTQRTGTLYAVATPAGASNDFTWTSSAPTVAAVTKRDNGEVLITAYKIGTTTITAVATDGSGARSSISVNVVTSPSTVTIQGNGTKEMKVGDRFTPTAIVSPPDATNKDVYWSLDPDDPNAASVISINSVTGLITALSSGTAFVRATLKSNPDEYDELYVDVSGKPQNLFLESFISPDRPIPLTTINNNYERFYAYTDIGDDDAVNWNISNTNIVTSIIDGNNLEITAIKAGTTVITATSKEDSRLTDSITVIITDDNTPSKIILSNDSIKLDAGTRKLVDNLVSAETDPYIPEMDFTWTTTAANIVQVVTDANGDVWFVGVNVGEAEIIVQTVTGNARATLTVKVVAPDEAELVITHSSLSENRRELMLWEGNTAQLGYRLTPTQASGTVTWDSTDFSVVIVDQYGMLTARKSGGVTITADLEDGDTSVHPDTITVNVYKVPKSIELKVDGVALDDTQATPSLAMPLTDTKTFSVDLKDASNSPVNLTWSTTNSRFIKITPLDDGTCEIEAVGKGTAQIAVVTSPGNLVAKVDITVY
ncbi:Ig-like domain-containing protein [Eubacteriales bacterium OttesenSCG-928-A19]|nr:Ig-like domain-containing protein [Eubacteriales bacterium OttesenSCG-928-A19]